MCIHSLMCLSMLLHRSMIIGEFQVQAYVVPESPLICRYCKPGVEFHNIHTQRCQMCTPESRLKCPTGIKYVACTADRDAHCPSVTLTVPLSLCNNKFVDFGEQCDASATHTETAACCTDSTCMLMQGYYVDPPCSTICGDGMLAGAEECDDMTDLQCDMTTCTTI